MVCVCVCVCVCVYMRACVCVCVCACVHCMEEGVRVLSRCVRSFDHMLFLAVPANHPHCTTLPVGFAKTMEGWGGSFV